MLKRWREEEDACVRVLVAAREQACKRVVDGGRDDASIAALLALQGSC